MFKKTPPKKNSPKKIPKKFKYNIGDLVACYTDDESLKIVVGWIQDRWCSVMGVNLYKIYWSDFTDDRDTISTPIDEKGMFLLVKLFRVAKKMDIWEGKKLF